jgi:hypothetical protein
MTRRILTAALVLQLVAATAAAQPSSGPWARVILSAGPVITSGTGSPEGVVIAPTGSLYLQSDGTLGLTLWSKVGSGATGWGTVSGGGGGGGPHTLLSTTHIDTTTASAIRGATIVGTSTPTWGRLTLGATGTFLRSNGSDLLYSSDGSSLTGLNASALATGTVPDARLSATVSLFGTAVDTAEIAPGAVTFGTWASNGCTTGQIAKYSGSAWACAVDDAGTGAAHSILSATHSDTVPGTLTAGDVLVANGVAALTRLGVGSSGQVLTVVAGAPAWAAAAGGGLHTTGITIDGAGAAFSTGIKGFQVIEANGTLQRVTLLSTDAAATACSVVMDVWKDTYTAYPPTVADSITASAKPTLTSANKSRDATLTGWSKTFTAGDVLGYQVVSNTGCTRVTLVLEYQ